MRKSIALITSTALVTGGLVAAAAPANAATISGWSDTTVGSTLNVTVGGVITSRMGQLSCAISISLNGVVQPPISAPWTSAGSDGYVTFAWTPTSAGSASFSSPDCDSASTGGPVTSPTITITAANPLGPLSASPTTVEAGNNVTWTVSGSGFGVGASDCRPALTLDTGSISLMDINSPSSASLTVEMDTPGVVNGTVGCNVTGNDYNSNSVTVSVTQPPESITGITDGVVGVEQTIRATGICPTTGAPSSLVVTYADGATERVDGVPLSPAGNATYAWTPGRVGTVTSLTVGSVCVPYTVAVNVVISPIPPPSDLTITGPAWIPPSVTADFTASSPSGGMAGTWELRRGSTVVSTRTVGAGTTSVTVSYRTPATEQVVTLQWYYAGTGTDFVAAGDPINVAVTRTNPNPTPAPDPAPIPPNPNPTPQPAPQGSTLSAPTGVTVYKAGNQVVVHYDGDPYTSQHVIYVNGVEALRTTDPNDAVITLTGSGPWEIGVQGINGFGASPIATLTLASDGTVSDDILIHPDGTVAPGVKVKVLRTVDIPMRKNTTRPVNPRVADARYAAVKRALERNPKAQVIVHGYQVAPGCGGPRGCTMDDRRANATKRALVRAGVPARKIQAVGAGINGHRGKAHRGMYSNILVYVPR